jgi:hypothetical protein
MKAHNIASVVHRNIEEPPLSTIWGRIERPTLLASGMVDWVSPSATFLCQQSGTMSSRSGPVNILVSSKVRHRRLLTKLDDLSGPTSLHSLMLTLIAPMFARFIWDDSTHLPINSMPQH